MTWWRHEEAENPAWPGLVDIFAFTLAVLMILWFAGNLPEKVESLEAETRDLGARISLLTGEKQQLQELNQDLRDQITRLAQTNRTLGDRVDLLEQTNRTLSDQVSRLDQTNRALTDQLSQWEARTRDLDAEKTRLQEANVGLSAELQTLSDKHAALRDIGRKDWQELLQMLQARLAGLPLVIIPHEQDKEIEIQGKPGITFETLKYYLSDADKLRLQRLAPILAELRRQKPFFITINGTADPREVHNAAPPRDNTELSALRAATVAALVENASPGLGRSLRVMGLGVKGQEKILAPGDDPDKFYQEYRRVSLVLKLDLAALMLQEQAGPAQ